MNCVNCNTSFESLPDKCTTCGFPFSGTEKEKSSFIAQQILKVGDIDEAKESLKGARNIFFVIGLVNIALAFLSYQSVSVLIIGLLVGGAFIVFGLVVNKSPLLFLSIALSLLLLFYLVDAIFDPMTLIKGIIWKIGFVGSLVYAIYTVKKSRKIKKESEYLNKQ